MTGRHASNLSIVERRARQQSGSSKGGRTPMSKYLTGAAPREQRLRRFVQLVHQGNPAREAYVMAGYKSFHSHAYRSLKNPSAQRLFRQLEARTRMRRNDITVDKIVDDLEEALTKAKANNQAAAMVQASMAQAKLCGLVVDRQETRNVSDMNLDELVKKLREALGTQADVVLAALGIISEKPEAENSGELPHPNVAAPTSVQ